MVLNSIVKTIEESYEDPYDPNTKAHITHVVRFYDSSRFKDYKTIRKERERFLAEADLYIQMRR
jgi:hypothetical protein